MPFITINNLRIYQFESFIARNITHGIFTRQGGCSPEPWDSLNVGSLVGDEPTRVVANRNRSVDALGRTPESLYEVWQVHGNSVDVTDQPRNPETEHIKADAIVTAVRDVTLYMRFADCVPIMLYDTAKHVCSIVHAGWQGTVNQVVVHTIMSMQEAFSSQPKNIIAGIGPSIGPEKYEVGQNVIEQVTATFGDLAGTLLHSVNGSVHLDLWEANRILLRQIGVESIEVSGICTASNLDDWFSHRAEKGKTGRFGALIGLE